MSKADIPTKHKQNSVSVSVSAVTSLMNQVSLLYDTYVKDAETLRDGVLQLQELLVDSFSDRFEQKEASKQSAAGT